MGQPNTKKIDTNKPPSNCPNCNGQREWSGKNATSGYPYAKCNFCTLHQPVYENKAYQVTSALEQMLRQKTKEAINEARKQVAVETFGPSFETPELSAPSLNEAIEVAYEGFVQLNERDSTPDSTMAKDLADKALYHHNEFHKGNHDEHHGGWAMHDLNTWAKNYQKKKEKGTYDREKAVKGLTHAVKNSEPAYFGTGHRDHKATLGKMSGATRTAAARHLLPYVEKLMPNHAKAAKPVKEGVDIIEYENLSETGPRKVHSVHYTFGDHGFQYQKTKNGFRHYKNAEGHEIKHRFPTQNGNHSFKHTDPAGKTIHYSGGTGDTEIKQHMRDHFPIKESEVNEADYSSALIGGGYKRIGGGNGSPEKWGKRGVKPSINRGINKVKSFFKKPRPMAEDELDIPSPEETAAHDKRAAATRAKAAPYQADFNKKWQRATPEQRKKLKAHAFAHNLDLPWGHPSMTGGKKQAGVGSRAPIRDFAEDEQPIRSLGSFKESEIKSCAKCGKPVSGNQGVGKGKKVYHHTCLNSK